MQSFIDSRTSSCNKQTHVTKLKTHFVLCVLTFKWSEAHDVCILWARASSWDCRTRSTWPLSPAEWLSTGWSARTSRPTCPRGRMSRTTRTSGTASRRCSARSHARSASRPTRATGVPPRRGSGSLCTADPYRPLVYSSIKSTIKHGIRNVENSHLMHVNYNVSCLFGVRGRWQNLIFVGQRAHFGWLLLEHIDARVARVAREHVNQRLARAGRARAHVSEQLTDHEARVGEEQSRFALQIRGLLIGLRFPLRDDIPDRAVKLLSHSWVVPLQARVDERCDGRVKCDVIVAQLHLEDWHLTVPRPVHLLFVHRVNLHKTNVRIESRGERKI